MSSQILITYRRGCRPDSICVIEVIDHSGEARSEHVRIATESVLYDLELKPLGCDFHRLEKVEMGEYAKRECLYKMEVRLKGSY